MTPTVTPIVCFNKAHFPTVSNVSDASVDLPRLSDTFDWLALTTSELPTSHLPPDVANWPPLTITEESANVTSCTTDPNRVSPAISGRLLSSGLAPLAAADRGLSDLLPIDLSGDLSDLNEVRDELHGGDHNRNVDDLLGGCGGLPESVDLCGKPLTVGMGFPGDRPYAPVASSGDPGGDVAASATSLSEYADATAPSVASSDSSDSDGGDGETAPEISLTDLPSGVELDDDQCRLISVARQLADVAAGLRSLPLPEDAEPVMERGDGGWSLPSASPPLPWVTSPLASPEREMEVDAGRLSSLGEVDEVVRRTAAEFSGQTSHPSQASSPMQRGFFGRGDLTEPLTSSGSEESLGPHVLRTDPAADDGDERPVCAQVRLVVRTREPGKEAVEIRSIRQFVDEERGQLEQAVCRQPEPPKDPSMPEGCAGLATAPSDADLQADDLNLMRTLRGDGRGKA